MTTLIVLSCIFLYFLIGATLGQIWERVARKHCPESGAYHPDHFYCTHTVVSFIVGFGWPMVLPLALLYYAGKKISGAIADVFVKEDK